MSSPRQSPRQAQSGAILFGVAAALVLAGGSLLAAYFVQVKDASASSVAAPGTTGVSDEAIAQVRSAAERYLATDITLRFDGREVPVTRADLGATLDDEEIAVAATRLSGAGTDLAAIDYLAGDLVPPVVVERAAAEEALRALKPTLDRAPVNARLDLEVPTVIHEKDGMGVDLFGSASAVEAAIRSGAEAVELEGAVLPAEITVESLGIDDVSAKISTFTTRFSVGERVRNDNLKLLASMIDGVVLQPGEAFSFNDTTGMRTLEDGFKMAHVITSGELVDGMAGGSCQISSTLHGAAFFGGLDIVRSTPHSRPSTYITMGLDATVVAGRVDLELRNPYDFPIAIHYRVARGESTVEIFGKEKPFDKVEFETEVTERLPFETITREDDELGVGNMVVDQPGYPGYKIARVRRVYDGKKVIRKDKWKIAYRPVVEYARIGVNPDPNLPPPETKKRKHKLKPASGKYRMVR